MINTPLQIKLVLVETAGALNLGSVARLCENFGVDELRLVSPKCDPNHPEAARMALRGKPFLERATLFASLLEAIKDCSIVISTCGRIDHGEIPINSTKEVFEWLFNSYNQGPIALVFGREDRGLSNKELLLSQKVISLKASKKYPSLNLSHSVGIILHELHNNYLELTSNSSKSEDQIIIAKPIEVNNLLKDAQELLLEIGFLLEHTSEARMTKIKLLLDRAEIRSEEVSLIRGMLRQTRWALNSNNS